MKRYAKSGGREISFLAAVEVVVVKEAGEVVIEVDLAGRGGGRSGGGGATAGWLRREMEAAKTELYSGGYGAESSWNSVRESGESDGGWAKNMTVGGSIQSHTNIINSEESWD